MSRYELFIGKVLCMGGTWLKLNRDIINLVVFWAVVIPLSSVFLSLVMHG